ncbi:MAG: DMT family transporter [Pseudomonadota bacterium]
MNIAILFPILAIVSGAMTAYQPLINAKLAQNMGSPIWASFVSFAVGGIALFFAAWIVSGKMITFDVSELKWWMLSGGLLGAVFVTVSIYIVPHLGVATMIALLIAGQLVAAAILDHFGVLSPAANPINLQKFIGLSLLALGAIITLKA